jgi:hypothetical protein
MLRLKINNQELGRKLRGKTILFLLRYVLWQNHLSVVRNVTEVRGSSTTSKVIFWEMRLKNWIEFKTIFNIQGSSKRYVKNILLGLQYQKNVLQQIKCYSSFSLSETKILLMSINWRDCISCHFIERNSGITINWRFIIFLSTKKQSLQQSDWSQNHTFCSKQYFHFQKYDFLSFPFHTPFVWLGFKAKELEIIIIEDEAMGASSTSHHHHYYHDPYDDHETWSRN